MGKYILSVGSAAVIIGILSSLTDPKGSTGVLMRMVCGLFLTVVVIQPIAGLDLSYISAFAQSFDTAAQAASADGIHMADSARREIIKAEAEAYILDKAASYSLELQVQVTLTDADPPVPETVRLTGAASPYARSKLQKEISDELGIPKEHQLWIG